MISGDMSARTDTSGKTGALTNAVLLATDNYHRREAIPSSFLL